MSFKEPLIFNRGEWVQGKWNGQNFCVLKCLGRGGVGQVYMVKGEQSGDLYALKISTDLHSLTREYYMIKNLNKDEELTRLRILPQVHSLDDTYHKEKLWHFFVMDYITGTSLSELIRSNRLEHKKLMSTVLKIAVFLYYLHKRGFILGDLKPDNIIFDSQKNVTTIVDLGGVTPMGAKLKEYTPSYDRQCWQVGKRVADPKYDLFSLSLLVLHMQNKKISINQGIKGLIKSCKNTNYNLIISKGLNQSYLGSREFILDAIKLYRQETGVLSIKKSNAINHLGFASLLFFVMGLIYLINN